MRKVVVAVVSVLFTLASCDSKRVEKLEEGVSTRADVRAQFGEPVAVYPDASDGKMSALRQVLKPSEFAKVTPGLDKAQVRRLLGRPASTQRFELKNEEQWNWRWLHGQATKVFSVTFDPDGRVITTAVVDDPRVVSPGG